jgi:hypothetical protein
MLISISSSTDFKVGKIYNSKELEDLGVLKEDILSIHDWMLMGRSMKPNSLSFEYAAIPISKMLKQINEMRSTFEEFPKDAKRASKILKLYKNKAKILPVVIEKNDVNLFVMEGRHRMMAQYDFGLTSIPTFLVSENKI